MSDSDEQATNRKGQKPVWVENFIKRLQAQGFVQWDSFTWTPRTSLGLPPEPKTRGPDDDAESSRNNCEPGGDGPMGRDQHSGERVADGENRPPTKATAKSAQSY
jgi:hypothetical protein